MQKFPPVRTSPRLSTSAYRNLASLTRRLARKFLEIRLPHRFVAHNASGLDTPRNQSHHFCSCGHFSDHDTRQPARQGEREELEGTGCDGMGPPNRLHTHYTRIEAAPGGVEGGGGRRGRRMQTLLSDGRMACVMCTLSKSGVLTYLICRRRKILSPVQSFRGRKKRRLRS
jgi:hypothetical protein